MTTTASVTTTFPTYYYYYYCCYSDCSPRDFLAAVDADGDGIISNEEFLKAGFLVDADGDGISKY